MSVPVQYDGGILDGQRDTRHKPPAVVRVLVENRFGTWEPTIIHDDGEGDDLDLDRNVPTRIERYELNHDPAQEPRDRYRFCGSQTLFGG